MGFALAACPAPFSVELEGVDPTPSVEPQFVTLRYFSDALGGAPIAPDCVGDEISDLRADIEIVDGEAFWHAAFPQPVASASLKRFFGDPALRNRLAPYDLSYLITVQGRSNFWSGGSIPGGKWETLNVNVEAELWRWDDRSFITHARAEGSGPAPKGMVLVFPWGYHPYGAESSTCGSVAIEIAKAIEQRDRPVRAVVLGAGGSGVASPPHMSEWNLMDLAAKAKDPGSESFYRLATYVKVDSELHGDWIAETQYRVGTTPGGYAKTGFVIPERWIWLCRAAHRDHARAQLKMGDYYRDGTDPVSPDPVKSYMWHVLAAANGSDDGAKRVANHRTQLTPDQLLEGEQLVRAWRPDPAKCDIEGAAWRAENRLSSRNRIHTDSSN